ncbi:eIF-2-alpha kinase GCN2 [Nymphon striatum]|nr:eIF-2-alpha kinase GCN2 [Nymphon striatum]
MSSDGHVQAALASGVAGKSVSRSQRAPAPLRIEDSDFVADFADGRWVVSWRWSRELPKTLQTRIGEYKCTQAPHVRERYNAEIQRWISKGWLKEWHGPIEGIIPLLAVFQPSKDKVRPVMDYRELNDFVECHTGDVIAVCGEKIREWRQLRGELRIVDLKSAYLQIHISENLWKYQVVKYKGVTYALTRLGFGLSCAPRIMTAILGKVLSMDERVRRGTDHYIDDIVVRESVLSAQELREHLARYGLESKAPEGLDGGRVLGISLRKGSGGHLEMSRGMALSEIVMDQSRLTKRGLFSLCGRLVGHYPVAGWLRPCCSFLKRLGCGGSWDEPVESSVGELANELLVRARAEDPVRGRWHVSPHGTVTVWTDASSLGMGVALEVDGSVAEDASWLRKESDHRHINVAELEAVARGINLAISWGFKTFTVATDSRTVISWMDNTVEGHRRVRTKGASEMLIKRRLGVIRDTITEFGLTVTVRFVSTTENKADRMTRVPKKWLGHRDTGEEGADVSAALATGESVEDAIWAAHLPHHLGVDRTLYLARQIRSNLTREQVKRELVGCEACQRIDPARREENLVAQGSLAVDGNWRRVAVDVTHYGAKHYLSMVDCGPSRFAIWRRLSSETAASIIAQLQGIVIERGPCDEFLLDNSTAFRSAAVEQFADEWGISLRFRAAYAPSGNGIVERNHRTIKRIAERGGISPEEATFWYNVTPRKDTDAGSVPSNGLYRYTWRVPFDVNLAKVESFEDSPFAVGDEVWVKPPIPSCTRQWSLGIVSDVVSRYVVRVDGMPRHVKDIRKRRYGSNRGVNSIGKSTMNDKDKESLETRQENEIEFLKAVYLEDFEDVRENDVWKVRRPPEIKLKLYPQRSMHENQDLHSQVTLYVKCDSNYPNCAPEFKIEDAKGISKPDILNLEKELTSLANLHIGEVMLFEIAQHVKEYLHTHNKPIYESMYEEMISNQKRQEEEYAKEIERKRNYMKKEEEKQSKAIQEEVLRRQEEIRKESRRRRSSSATYSETETEAEQKGNSVSPERQEVLKKNFPDNENTQEICAHHQGSTTVDFLINKIVRKIRRSNCLGHGEYGELNFAGIDLDNGKVFIITEWLIFFNPNVKKLNSEDPNVISCMKQLAVIEQELLSMHKLDHPGLLKYLAIKYKLDKNKIILQIATKMKLITILMYDDMIIKVLKEFSSGTSLSYYIRNTIPVETHLLQHITTKILDILNYLHENSVVHKDLSDTCIYLEQTGDVKLSDYSIQRRILDLLINFSKKNIIDRYPLSLGRGGKKSDIYRLVMFDSPNIGPKKIGVLTLSRGLVLMSLAQGKIVSTMVPNIPMSLPTQLFNFLSNCLEQNEKERWGINQLQQHTFIQPGVGDRDNDVDDLDKDLVFRAKDGIPAEGLSSVPFIVSDGSNQGRIKEEFQIIKWLGKGGFGDVVKVQNKLDGGIYAIKRIPLNPSSRLLNKKITREVKLLSRLNHENVVRYFNSWIETQLEDTNEADSNTSCTFSTSTPASDVSKFKPVEFSSADKADEWAVDHIEKSIDWTVSSHHPLVEEEESSDEEDVFGMPYLIKSDSSDIVFESSENNLNDNTVQSKCEETTSDKSKDKDAKIKSLVNDQRMVQWMYIQMEFCEKSTLRTAIDDCLYKEKDRMWRLFREIIEGLVHIHDQGMIHRDLKPVNIFLDSCDHIKIGDFGLATTVIRSKPGLLESSSVLYLDPIEISHSEQHGGSMTGQVGTALYVAPELSAGRGVKPIYSQKVDIYSLGIMFFEMCYPPLATGMERVKILANIRMEDIKMPKDVEELFSEKQIKLIYWLLNHDQNSRPSSQQLLSSDLLPPAQIEQTQLNEHFRKTIANPQSKAYKYLISSLFQQETTMSADITYDMDLWYKQATCIKSSLAFRHIKEKIQKVFHKHGAVDINVPLLIPQAKQSSSEEWSVNLMDHGGDIVSLPRDLRLNFARAIARRDFKNIKRYAIDRVYRKRKVFGQHPKELIECSFDIVTNSCTSLIPDAEVLMVTEEILNEFPLLQSRNYVLKLNHANIIQAILNDCGISEERHNDIYSVLKEFHIKHESKFAIQTELSNMEFSESTIGQILNYILEDSIVKISNLMKPIMRKKGAIGSLAKHGLNDLKTIIDHLGLLGFSIPIGSLAKHGLNDLKTIIDHLGLLGFSIPIIVSPMLAYNVSNFSGVIFQFVCELKKKRKSTIDVIAAGGRYDSLVSSYKFAPTSVNHGAVGVSISVDKIINCISEDEKIEGLADAIVCSVGNTSLIREKCAICQELWASGIKTTIHYDYIQVRVIDKDRFTEKKVYVSELCEYISKSLLSKCDINEVTSSVGSTKSEPLKNNTSSDITSPVSSNINIVYLTDKQKFTQVVKRRYEVQIISSLSSLRQIISGKINVEVIATDLLGSVIKTICSVIEISNQEDFNKSIPVILEKHQRHRKFLQKLCDEIHELHFEKRCPVIVLYSVTDNVHKVII